jgi:cytochrome c peroxidase
MGAVRLRGRQALVALGLALGLIAPFAAADDGLPPGTDLGQAAALVPREVFASEAEGGRQPELTRLGGLLFAAPGILGPAARSAGVSCQTCHTAGHANTRLLIPGLSKHAGTIDVTSGFFNPKADDLVFNPVRIPTLRGIRYLAPYGREGRIASLRGFVRKVIVEEFGGPEPSARVLDALVAHIEEIDFLPNPRLGPDGLLLEPLSAAERRGQTLFGTPPAGMGGTSCAGCHPPGALFTDHRRHDVGSGGVFKTPTLLGLDFRAPYFHDGRYLRLQDAVAHFDDRFRLGLSTAQIRDLVAYLEAVGDASAAEEPDSLARRIGEIAGFCGTLDRLAARQEFELLPIALDAIGRKLAELATQFPGAALEPARRAIEAAAAEVDAIGNLASGEGPAAALARLAGLKHAVRSLGTTLAAYEARSLFDPARRNAHYASLAEVEVLRGN